MKDSWLFYDYLRSWWWALLLCSTIGGVSGLIYNNYQEHALEYTATARVVIEDSRRSHGIPEIVLVSIETGTTSAAETAIDSARRMITRVGDYTGATVRIKDLSVARSVDNKRWWKDTVFGGIIGTLLAIGVIYTWNDARSYQRRRQDSA
jgi:hypothetical protein